MALRKTWRLAAIACLLAGALVAPAAAQQELPQDPRQKLEELDGVLLKSQMALFAARQGGGAEEIEKARKSFEEVQQRRGPLVRAAKDLY